MTEKEKPHQDNRRSRKHRKNYISDLDMSFDNSALDKSITIKNPFDEVPVGGQRKKTFEEMIEDELAKEAKAKMAKATISTL